MIRQCSSTQFRADSWVIRLTIVTVVASLFSRPQIVTELRDKLMSPLGDMQLQTKVNVAKSSKIIQQTIEQFKMALGCQMANSQ